MTQRIHEYKLGSCARYLIRCSVTIQRVLSRPGNSYRDLSEVIYNMAETSVPAKRFRLSIYRAGMLHSGLAAMSECVPQITVEPVITRTKKKGRGEGEKKTKNEEKNISEPVF